MNALIKLKVYLRNFGYRLFPNVIDRACRVGKETDVKRKTVLLSHDRKLYKT